MPSLRDQLRDVIAEIGEIDQLDSITDDADLYQDLGLDSMQGLEIILEIEKRFSLTVPEEALQKIRSLADVVQLAKDLGAGGDD